MNVHTKRNGMWFVRKNVSYDIQNKCASRSRCAFRRIQTAKKRSLHKSTPIRKMSFRFSGVVHRWKKKSIEKPASRGETQQRYIDSYFVHHGAGNSPVIWGGRRAKESKGERGGGREKKNPGYNGTKPLWIFKTHRPAHGTLLSTICCIVCKSFFL